MMNIDLEILINNQLTIQILLRYDQMAWTTVIQLEH